MQRGVPLSSIVNQLTQDITGSLQQQLGGKLSQSQLTALQTQVTQSLSNALDPPSNGPPQSATQQASALAQRLDALIAAIAGYAKQNGQQNDISGNLLDAKSAKEAPAQQEQRPSNATFDVSSLVQSLLSQVAAQVQSAQSGSDPKLGSSETRPIATFSINPSVEPSSAPSGPPPSVTSSNNNAPAQPLTMANAPDLLARMLVRAASVDAQISGNAATVNAQASGSNAGGSAPSASTVAAQLAATISDVIAAAGQTENGGTNLGGQNAHSNLGAPTTQAQTATVTSPSGSSTAANGLSFGNALTQTQAAVQTVAAAAQAVDVNAVIEQMVKGMSMRTDTQGSSTINLHLQPDSLGDVQMKITVSGSQISANVVAQNADVRSALLSNQQQLTKSLAEAGLTLTGFSVDVSGGNANQQGNQNQAKGFGRRYVVHELNGASQEPEALSNLGPPLLSGSGLELFNYLA